MSTPACVLDTHAWTLLVSAPDCLPARARRVAARSDMRLVPAICMWELALLHQAGRWTLTDPDDTLDRWMATATADPQGVAPLSADIAIAAAGLDDEGFHRDPADRLIYATARMLDAPLITRDAGIHRFEADLPKRARRLAVWA
jgi:hypothetical protein